MFGAKNSQQMQAKLMDRRVHRQNKPVLASYSQPRLVDLGPILDEVVP